MKVNRRTVRALASLVMLGTLSSTAPLAQAQEGQSQPNAEQGENRPPGGGFGGPFGGGGFGRFRFMRGAQLFVWTNRLEPYVAAMAELNMSPDFSLSRQQKAQIVAIRDTFKKTYDTWRADHNADIEDMQAEYREMFRGGGGGGYDEDRVRQIREAARDLMAAAPMGDEEIKQIQALLTPDQVKLVDTKVEQLRIEADRRRMDGFGGGPGGAMPSGSPATTEATPETPRNNDETNDDRR